METNHWTPAPSVAYTLTRDDGDTSETFGEGLSGLIFTDTDVTAGTTYTYQVAAVVTGGEATRSALSRVAPTFVLKYNIRTRSLADPGTIEDVLAVENDVVPFDRADVLGAGLRPGLPW